MSKSRLWMGVLAISALAVGCGGNNNRNGGTQGAAGTSGSTDVNGGKTMTMRGCVQEGTPGGTYVLKRTGPGEESGGTAGTSGSGRPSGGSDVNGTFIGQNGQALYRLIATGNLDLGQNVGKEVSVTGELANQAQDNTGAAGTSGSSNSDRTRRQGTSGEGDAGTNLENGGSRGSGGGRVQGNASDRTAGAQFFRVTSMTKVADSCN